MSLSGTREITFLPSNSSVTCIVARNSLLRPSLVKRVASGAFNPKHILGAFGVKGTQSAELAKWGLNIGGEWDTLIWNMVICVT